MEARKIRVGSDFSGVGAFPQALKRLNIDYKEVFSCDFDKYARQSYIHNYGEPLYYPENVYDRAIPTDSLDIYMTSPPCQAFSLAGKRKGETDKRGVLFYNSHEFIQVNKPRYFIFENVKGLLSDDGGKTFQRWLDMLGGKTVNGNPVIFPHDEATPYHVYHKVLNAKDYGIPQNRERVFIIGIRDDVDNDFSFPKPMHLELRLRDVLEEDVDEKYFLSNKMVEGLTETNHLTPDRVNNALRCGVGASLTKKHSFDMVKVGFINQDTQASQVFDEQSIGQTLCAGTHGYANGYVKVKSATKIGYELATTEDSINFSVPNSETRRGRVGKGVAQTLDTACNQGVFIGAMRGRYNEDNKTEQKLEINKSETSNTITSVQKDNLVVQLNPSKESGGKQPYQQNRIYADYGLMTCLDTASGQKSVFTDYKIRRLTPRECFRLMDFPDTYEIVVSDTQAYKQAGNSICVGVLAEIISKLKL